MKSMEMWAEVADRPFSEQPKHVQGKETACGPGPESCPWVSILRLGDPGQFTRPLVFSLWQRQGNNLP